MGLFSSFFNTFNTFMRLSVKSLILLSLIFLISCSKGSSSDNKRETRIDEAVIQEILENQNFECASLGGRCPEGISRLFIVDSSDPNRSAVCSGFMVSQNRLVTNHHCVPNASACRNTFIATYTGTSHVTTRCKSIIKTEQDSNDPNDPARKLDYTVMEVEDNYQSDFFNLSLNQAQPQDIIHSWVIDHTGLDDFPSNLFESRITEFECTVADQTERASLLMLKCPIISGNSGSPALNTNGNVIGVIWGGSLGTIDSSFDLETRRELDEVGLATETRFFIDAVNGN